MSFLSGLFGTIGHAVEGVLGIQGDDDKADETRKKLEDAIKAGGLQASAEYGKQGQGLANQANQLQGTNVDLDWNKVNQDSAALDPVRQHYLQQYQNGGLQGQAAVVAEQASRGLNASSGIAGIHNDILNSGNAQQAVANTAQNEIAQAGSAVNNLDTQKAAMALRKAVLTAQVSHANFTNHLAAQQVGFGLVNNQQNLVNTAQEAANNLNYNTQLQDLNYQQQQYDIGKQITQMLASLATQAASTGASAFGASATQPTGTGVAQAGATQIVPSQSGTGAGYIQAPATVGRSAVVNNQGGASSSPAIFGSQSPLPVDASYFNRGVR